MAGNYPNAKVVAVSVTQVDFEKAKKKYSTDWLLGEDERLFLKFDFEKTDKVVVEYNLEKIGMEQR